MLLCFLRSLSICDSHTVLLIFINSENTHVYDFLINNKKISTFRTLAHFRSFSLNATSSSSREDSPCVIHTSINIFPYWHTSAISHCLTDNVLRSPCLSCWFQIWNHLSIQNKYLNWYDEVIGRQSNKICTKSKWYYSRPLILNQWFQTRDWWWWF